MENKPDVLIVFVTAYDEYAVQAFEINALDYILKPISMERLNIGEAIDIYNEICDNLPEIEDAYFTLMQIYASINKYLSELNTLIEEGISSAREVVAFDRHEWELGRIRKRFNKYFEKVMKEGKLSNKLLFTSEPVMWVMNITVLCFAGNNLGLDSNADHEGVFRVDSIG